MLKEFRTFIAQGNVLDLAVGVIIGAAFGKITSSLVDDILNPIIGLLLGGVDFSQMKIVLKEAVGTAPEVAIRYGNFLTVVIQFVLVALVIFMVVKAANRMKKSQPELVEA
ncbi:large-conductance mechanosensitive channel protein MscL [Fibrella sp. HMF5335]|uniref:Large-conductance mechanosensitive channel n=1 Tax=Fibrella rubiginis TaxID=2817060 RepID=A0A939K5Z1_9BACT|nr:large-conductance mechanosensitive channel protein MscL [Fibrella rubiginis]MBO0937766.1 large-conductance mechanosensitive channel protein MscL [Fibrella rubiginis]